MCYYGPRRAKRAKPISARAACRRSALCCTETADQRREFHRVRTMTLRKHAAADPPDNQSHAVSIVFRYTAVPWLLMEYTRPLSGCRVRGLVAAYRANNVKWRIHSARADTARIRGSRVRGPVAISFDQSRLEIHRSSSCYRDATLCQRSRCTTSCV